jgi:hypothetical protein
MNRTDLTISKRSSGVHTGGCGGISNLGISYLILAFLALGMAVRLNRYLACFPFWGDEACLAANFINRDYAQLLRPLDYGCVAPLLFLWIEKAVVNLSGFTEFALRLFPTICSVLSVLVFYRASRRVLNGLSLLLATAIFSVSYYPIRHGAEVKPYASDLFASLILVWLALEYFNRADRKNRFWALCAFVPVALALSYPAVFVAGGIAMALLYQAIRLGETDARREFLIYAMLLGGFFALAYFSFTRIQLNFELRDLGGNHMFTIWDNTFPPLAQPVRLIVWLIRTHTGRMFAYPVGDVNGGSTATLICFISGIIALGRRKDQRPLFLFLAPFVLAFAAAAVHRYPYGYSARWMLYLAPIICIVAGLGAAELISRIKDHRWRKATTIGVITGLGLIGLGCLVLDLIQPYKEKADWNSRVFARNFWNDIPEGSQLLCLKTDFGKDFFPDLFTSNHNSARYLCNQKTYSLRHHKGVQVPLGRERRADRIYNLVVYSTPGTKRDNRALAGFFKTIRRWADRTDYRLYDINGDLPEHHEIYEVYEFTAK